MRSTVVFIGCCERRWRKPASIRRVATVHPSAILRSPDSETRHRETAKFLEDLHQVAAML